MQNLLSTPTLVESPFIIVKIGDYTFGHVEKTRSGNDLDVTFPNYLQSVSITKINGEVNTYNLSIEYPIVKGEDPNLMDYVFSSVSSSRKLTISYGDWASPSFIYKEEPVLITNITSSIDFRTPKISYSLTCQSEALALKSTNFNFGTEFAKPSDIILRLLNNKKYGLTDIFQGMSNINKVLQNELIATDDLTVHIDAVSNANVFDYLCHLVNYMIPQDNATKNISGFYRLSVIDDNKNEMGGAYFKVQKISQDANIIEDTEETNSSVIYNSYELDIGYPEKNLVTDFSIENGQEWTILYEAAKKSTIQNYSYKMHGDGTVSVESSPSITRSSTVFGTTAEDKSWWTSVTEFPLQAKVTLKGLVRPSMLMTYIKINSIFYGQRHISSGYYIITGEQDEISGSGYKTTLSLLRIKGDTPQNSLTTILNKALNQINIYKNNKRASVGTGRTMSNDTTSAGNASSVFNNLGNMAKGYWQQISSNQSNKRTSTANSITQGGSNEFPSSSHTSSSSASHSGSGRNLDNNIEINTVEEQSVHWYGSE